MDFNLDENLWNQLTELLSSFGISFFIALCILIIGRQAIKIIIKIILRNKSVMIIFKS